MIRILHADDYELVRLGLRSLLRNEDDLALVGETASFAETLSLAQRVMPDVVLLKPILSDKTVRNQLVNVYSKLDVAGQLELAVKAAQLGLV